MLSQNNYVRLLAGKPPIIDEIWINRYPCDSQRVGKPIVVHHLGDQEIAINRYL